MDPNQNQNKRGLVDNFNSAFKTARRFNRRGFGQGFRKGRGISATQALRKQVRKRGLIFLLSNPIGWFLIIFVLLLILILIIFLFFLPGANNQEQPPDPGTAETCDTGICYYKYGPAQVPNPDVSAPTLCYTLELIVDKTKVPNYGSIVFYDNYPEAQVTFETASGTYNPATTTEVDWVLSDNSPGDLSAICPDLPQTTLVQLDNPANEVVYYFQLVVRVNNNVSDTTLTNQIGYKGEVISGAGQYCTAGNQDTCGGKYNLNNVDGLNFGDPYCEVADGGRSVVRDRLFTNLQSYGKTKDFCVWRCIISKESSYNPNLNNCGNGSKDCWGLFSMEANACYSADKTFFWRRTGNVYWRDQIIRALELEYKTYEPNGTPFDYWSTYKYGVCKNEPRWTQGMTCSY